MCRFLAALLFVVVVNCTRRERDESHSQEWCDGEFGTEAMVSTTNTHATLAGVEILRRGGNAYDAAAAIQWTLSLVQPQSTGIGGGALIVFYDAANDKIYTLDGREEAPELFHENIFCDTSTLNYTCVEPCVCASQASWTFSERNTGANSAGTPGAVAAFGRLHDEFGSLPFATTFDYPTRLALDGFEMYQNLYNSINNGQNRLRRFPASAAVFLPNNQVPPVGSLFRNPGHASTFQHLAQNGWRSFYEGELASEIARASREAVNNVTGLPGLISESDLANYRAVYREPVRVPWAYSGGGLDLYGFPSPSAGGMLTAQTAGILGESNAELFRGPLSVDYLHKLIDAQDLAWSDRSRWMGDADFVDVPFEGLINPEYISSRFNDLLSDSRSAGAPVPAGNPPGASDEWASDVRLEEQGTTHFTVTDRFGNMVSATTTVEGSLGCGVVVPNRGFLLNNELTDFTDLAADPDTGRLYANRPEGGRQRRRTALGSDQNTFGGKRPLSSMAPTIVMDRATNRPVLGLGSPGGTRIPGQNLNVLYNLLLYGTGLQTAIDTPRAISRNGGAELEQPLASDKEVVDELRARGFTISTNNNPGYVQAVQVRYTNDTGTGFEVCGAADIQRLPSALCVGY